jgi:predicted nucleic acid-binding protein
LSLVVDASLTLAWVFERQSLHERQLADRLLDGLLIEEAFVPWIWHLEVANALLVAERRGVLTQARSTDFLARLGALPIRTDPASPLETTERITSLGRSFQLSSYDASYLELALRLGLGLASFDRALLVAASAAGVAVYD